MLATSSGRIEFIRLNHISCRNSGLREAGSEPRSGVIAEAQKYVIVARGAAGVEHHSHRFPHQLAIPRTDDRLDRGAGNALAVVLLLFGAPKLPGLARSIGQSMRIFRSEVKTMKDENGNDVVVEDEGDEPVASAKASTTKASTAKAPAAKSAATKAAPKNPTKSKP